MAPSKAKAKTSRMPSSRLQVPSLLPFYSSPSLSSSTSDLDSSSDSPLSPQDLYAESFDHIRTFNVDRPHSAQSLPSAGRFRKNMKDITGFGTTDEEFEALPIAVRRKYFSTLERLRFAQSSRSNALNEVRLPIQRHHHKTSLADRRGLNIPVIDPRRKGPASRRQGKLVRQQSVSSNEASWFLTLPEKIKKKEFTREEQVILAGRLRESVILDAADEAIYRATRRASQNLTPLFDAYSPTRARMSKDSSRFTDDSISPMAEAMYESFRWMDEEEDINLKLVLDDYHANLDGFVLPTPDSTRRPSFRRTMSISKMPFGRNSLSSIQPRSPQSDPHASHSRQKSRALSLIAPKHVLQESISSIDPNATHYQDPEARLKLRVYLASPQKFDEAIEFGFPSMDGVADGADKENKAPKRLSKDITGTKSHGTEKAQSSFLNDDAGSLFEDDTSMNDPESPLTPMGIDLGLRPRGASPTFPKAYKTSSDFSHLVPRPTIKQPDSYAQVMAGSREMTLRMTLTRPDLRADENTLYGWQMAGPKSPLREESLALDDLEEKYECRGPLGGVDGWGPAEKENGVVKRFWNRVKSQRKSS